MAVVSTIGPTGGRNQNNVDTLHFTLFTINYGHFLCQALTECCRYGERETGDWRLSSHYCHINPH